MKLALVAVAVVVSLVHNLVIGPRATAKLREASGSAEALRLRRLASWTGRVNLLLGVGILAVAIMLVRGLPT